MKKIFKTYPCLLVQLCQVQLLLIASNACLQKQKPFDRTAERRLYLLNSASAERVSHVTGPLILKPTFRCSKNCSMLGACLTAAFTIFASMRGKIRSSLCPSCSKSHLTKTSPLPTVLQRCTQSLFACYPVALSDNICGSEVLYMWFWRYFSTKME